MSSGQRVDARPAPDELPIPSGRVSARLAKSTFWASAAALVFAQVGYPLVLRALPRRPFTTDGDGDGLPTVSLIVAAYAEEDVIAAKVANALALDYPRERLQVIVACDGSPDATPQRARDAGADLVLELPRGGKIRAQDGAVARSTADVVAFSDANALWEPAALRRLVAPFADPEVAYVCGQVSFVNPDGAAGTNQEGVYWRYEMWLRAAESERWSVTAGNGAIYATRREDYLVVDPVMGHDLSFPFNLVRRGRRAVYAPDAHATEKMV
ncbi:MAG: glycosyl transferase family 2, partial [Solirubrobacterales bacterium]|nr:glycosyl transferase family 2 [Solirubrobacterales bacterium]